MGTLVAKRYPAFGGAVPGRPDHTYVECGTGQRAWSCWGGKTGGTDLRRSAGSTNRADAIAGTKERAGISCYLINGVCHQAANRILLPARILVSGAAGYGLSESIFGPYGRPRGVLGFCKAPFDQHPAVDGDLPACTEPLARDEVRRATVARSVPPAPPAATPSASQRRYVESVLRIYETAMGPQLAMTNISPDEGKALGRALFLNRVEFELPGFSRRGALEADYADFDDRRDDLEEAFQQKQLAPSEFAVEFNRITIGFQEKMAGELGAGEYASLLNAQPGQWLVLADPDFVEQAYQ